VRLRRAEQYLRASKLNSAGGFFHHIRETYLKNKIIMDAAAVERSITRLSHEILENNNNNKIVLVGIHRRGVPLALRIRKKINEISGLNIQQGSLDITFHRDDFRERLVVPQVRGTDISFSLDGKVVILIDDVLYTGRTIRASLDELNSFGRAAKVQLAVLVDRGHRELPIKADFIGKSIPTHEGEHVSVTLKETDKQDSVILIINKE